MRQIGLLPAGCHQCDQIVIHASEDKLLFASKLALYVINAKSYATERIISCQARSIISLSVNPYNMNLVACSGVDGTVCVWDISTEEVMIKCAHPCNALAWDPHNQYHCALVSNYPKLTLHVWDTRPNVNTTTRMYVHDSDTVSASVVRWNPHIQGQIAIGCSNGVVYIVDCEKRRAVPLKVVERTLSVVDIQWDRLSAVYMIVAYQSFISLWDTEVGNEVHVFEKQSAGVSCLAWMDWTAGNFVSSNPKTGVIKLWNASQKQPLESIRVHSAGINAIYFAAGGSSRMFCSCADGALVLYNMKNRQVEFKTQSGHTDTIFECEYQPKSPDALATCSYDGTVKIWNVPDLSLTQTLYGTDCIIYSCSWSPDSKKIAATTIAGELLIWDAETSRVMAKYKYHTKASYAVAWNQFNPSLLLTTSADNTAVVIEVNMEDIEDLSSQKNQRIGSRRNHKTAKKISDYATPVQKTVYKHASPVFGCAWSAHSALGKYFATGCQDSIVRLFEYPSSDGACLHAFSGHSARSFSVAWSPLIPGLLASGSDDKKVLVWEVELPKVEGSPKRVNFMRQLVGHKSNIRALSWNHEQRQILISGSWDATMRIWNVVSATCLQVIFDHVADIYTVTSHPARPFCYVSCSRDSTLRVWEIEGLIMRLRYKAILTGTLESIIGDTTDGRPPDMTWTGDSLEPVLYGRASRQLNKSFNIEMTSEKGGPPVLSGGPISSTDPVDNLALAEMYRNFYNYFSGSNGSNNFWDCVVAVCKHRIDPSNKHLAAQYAKMNANSVSGVNEAFPEHAIIGIAKSSARQLEQVKTTVRRGDIGGKAEEQLRQAAMIFAQTGDFIKYCSIMIEIGDWMAALAMAPCVSHDYWLHLMKGHSQHLKNKLSEDCIPYLIGTGQDREAVDFYLSRKDALSAMIVSKMSETRTDIIPDLSDTREGISSNEKDSLATAEVLAYTSWAGGIENECRDRTETEEEESRRMVRQVALRLVEANISLAKPICAAAHLVAVNDVDAAIQVLLLCGEYDMAYATARCFGKETDHLLVAMAQKAEYLKDIDLALSIYEQLPYPQSEREAALLIARKTTPRSGALASISSQNSTVTEDSKDFAGDGKDKATSSHDEHLQSAREAEAIGHDDEAVLNYILGGNHKKAAEIGLSRLNKFIFTPFQISPVAKRILQAFRNIRAKDLSETLRLNFLCNMSWFGAHLAIQRGFWVTSWSMLKVLSQFVTSDFPIPRSIVAIQELCVRVQCKDDGVLELLDNILIELKHDCIVPDQVSAINRHLQSIRSLIQDSSRALSSTGLLGGRLQSMSPVSLCTEPLYGVLTAHIESEVRNLQSVMGLPTLPSTQSNPPTGVPPVLTSEFGVGGVGSVLGLPTVMQGSLLPVANQGMKVLTSCVTGRKVLGTVVMLEDDASFVPLNEAVMWKQVNPYSPLFTGSFINIF